MGYKFIKEPIRFEDDQTGSGTYEGYQYEWNITGVGHSVFVTNNPNYYLAQMHRHDDLGWGIVWAEVRLPKEIVGDVFVLITDIAAEIDSRIEEANNVSL